MNYLFLILTILFFSLKSNAIDNVELKAFVGTVQNAFNIGKKANTNLPTYHEQGECVHVHTPNVSGQPNFTYLTNSSLDIMPSIYLGNKYLTFGYGRARRTPAFLNNTGDLTNEFESDWYSGEASGGNSYKKIGSEILRIGEVYGLTAYIFIRTAFVYANDTEQPPVSKEEIYCYFEK